MSKLFSSNNQMKSDLINRSTIYREPGSDIVAYKIFKNVENSIKTMKNVMGLGRSLTNHGRFFTQIESTLEWLRMLLRSTYKSYKFYGPEVKMGQCLIKHAHVTYPNLSRRLRVQNFSKIGQNLYMLFANYVNSVLIGGGTNLYDESASARIGSKVAEMTRANQPGSIYSTPINARNTVAPNQFYGNPNYVNPFPMQTSGPNNMHSLQSMQRWQRMASLPNRRFERDINGTYSTNQRDNESDRQRQPYSNPNIGETYDDVVYAGPRQYPNDMSYIDEAVYMDPDANINLTNKTAIEEADNLFNYESIILESFGIERNSISKYSLLWCVKEYTKDALRRFTETVLLG